MNAELITLVSLGHDTTISDLNKIYESVYKVATVVIVRAFEYPHKDKFIIESPMSKRVYSKSWTSSMTAQRVDYSKAKSYIRFVGVSHFIIWGGGGIVFFFFVI